MLSKLLQLVPEFSGAQGTAILTLSLCAVAGVFLWVMGARYSKSMLTLLAVALGTLVGKQLPDWFGWSINPWMIAIAGALVLGLSAYIWHFLWVGLALGIVLVVWAGVGSHIALNDSAWTWPQRDPAKPEVTNTQYLKDALATSPASLQKTLPIACGIALVCGIAAGLLWPRFAMSMLYSLGGTAIMILCGARAIDTAKPGWLATLSENKTIELAVLAGIVLIGLVLQWRYSFRRPAPKPAPPQQG